MTDTLPDDVNFVSATGSAQPNASGMITFNVGNLADSGTETFQVVVTTTGASPTFTTDAATITGNQYDPNSANNTRSVSVPITARDDLAVGMCRRPVVSWSGDEPGFTRSRRPKRAFTGRRPVVTDTLPALDVMSHLVSASGGIVASTARARSPSTPATWRPTPRSLIRSPSCRQARRQRTLRKSRHGRNHRQRVRPQRRQQYIAGADHHDVNAPADLAVNVSAAASGLVGENLVYTITATNNGPSPASGVVVTDTLPALADVTFVSASGGVVPDTTGELTFNTGNLAAEASVTYTVTVVPTERGDSQLSFA